MQEQHREERHAMLQLVQVNQVLELSALSSGLSMGDRTLVKLTVTARRLNRTLAEG